MLPLIFGGALIGAGAHLSASLDRDEAKKKIEEANEIIESSSNKAKEAEVRCNKAKEALIKERTKVLQNNIARFVKCYKQIAPINFQEVGDGYEVIKFDKNEIVIMQKMVQQVQKVSVNDVAGGVSGTALALGAADMLAGGTILSSASLSIGGLAGGAALSAMAAPIFAITGVFSASEAAENLEKAKSNLEKAYAYEDQCKTYVYVANSISDRCDLYTNTINYLNEEMFSMAMNKFETLVASKKTFSNTLKNIAGKRIYTREEMAFVGSVASLAKAIKTLVEANILDSNGNLVGISKDVTSIIEKAESGQIIIAPLEISDKGNLRISSQDNNKNGQAVVRDKREPFYKKLWFWIVIIVLMLIGAFSEPAEDTSKNSTVLEDDGHENTSQSQIQEDENQGITNEDVLNTETDINNSNVNVPNTETDINDSNVNVPNTETDTNDSNVKVKEMKEVYEVRGELKNLLALNDGTFVLLEKRDDGNYYIVKSTGEEIQLNSFDDRYGCGLSYDAYKNILYLLISDYDDDTNIYIVKDEGTIESVTTVQTLGGGDIADVGVSDCQFFSDGRMIGSVWGRNIIDSNTWNKISGDAPWINAIINDKMYDLKYNFDTYQYDSIREIDFQGNVVREYVIPEKIDSELLEDGQIYRTNKYLYYIGARNGKDYVYRFDGKKWDNIVCLSDYNNHTKLYYDHFCVTEDAIRVFDKITKTIKEYKLK